MNAGDVIVVEKKNGVGDSNVQSPDQGERAEP